MAITLMIAMFSREAILIMSSKGYYSGWTSVYWLTLAYGFYGLIVLSSIAIEIAKKNWVSSSFWIVGAVINTILNILLIPAYGIMGASLATVISYGIILLGYWIAIRFIYPVPFKYGHFFSILILGTIIYLLSIFVEFDIILSVIVKAGLLLMFMVVAILGGYLTKEEVDIVKNMISATWISFYQRLAPQRL
jgi:O-antigen/teichoic acid export membrane protein